MENEELIVRSTTDAQGDIKQQRDGISFERCAAQRLEPAASRAGATHVQVPRLAPYGYRANHSRSVATRPTASFVEEIAYVARSVDSISAELLNLQVCRIHD